MRKTNYTMAELVQIATEAAKKGLPMHKGAELVTEALVEALGVTVAPEPVKYTEGTVAWVYDPLMDDGIGGALAQWNGETWMTVRSTNGEPWDEVPSGHAWSVEIVPTYDPATQIVIPLDKVPAADQLDFAHSLLVAEPALTYVPNFLRYVAEQAREGK